MTALRTQEIACDKDCSECGKEAPDHLMYFRHDGRLRCNDCYKRMLEWESKPGSRRLPFSSITYDVLFRPANTVVEAMVRGRRTGTR